VIAADYALTDSRMAVLLERHQARGADGHPVEVAQQSYEVDETAMRTVMARLARDHGSIEGYALAQGLEADAVASLRASLLT
jgi:hypothetical protein